MAFADVREAMVQRTTLKNRYLGRPLNGTGKPGGNMARGYKGQTIWPSAIREEFERRKLLALLRQMDP